MASIKYRDSSGKFIPLPLGGDSHEGVSQDVIAGHKGYYIQAINTEDKWVILSDSETKPEYPEIGDDVIDKPLINAPYAGVYQVTSDKDVTVTNETGHTATLTAGETSFFYLIKGYNNLILSDETATLTFTELEDNGMDYIAEVDVGTTPITSAEKETIFIGKQLFVGSATSITMYAKQAGLYYIQMQINDNNTNLIGVETDTGFNGFIQQYRYGWNSFENGADETDLLIVYLREGRNTFAIINNGGTASYINAIAICNTEEYNNDIYPQYASQLSMNGCNVTLPHKSMAWVGAAQNQDGYFNGYAGGTNTNNELKPGDYVEITVENMPYTGVYAFQLYIESITGGDVANIRVITNDGYYSDYELTQSGMWTNRMNPPKDMPLYMNKGDNIVRIINIGTSTVILDDTDCGRLDVAGADKSLDFLDMVKTNFPKDNSFQYKLDNYDLGYSVGDEFSMVNGAHYDFCGTITNIEGKKVYYEEDLPFINVDKTTNDFDDHIFFVPSKPDVGIVNIVTIAFATGIDTKAAGKSSFGAGRNNVAGGDYSFVAGRNNLASYCAAALGLNTQAKGRYTFSAGYFAKALGEYSVAINNYTIAKGENSFAHGYGTLATGDNMVAGGKCNLTEDGAIVVYGNGDDWAARKDAYILDWDGNGWYAGSLKVENILHVVGGIRSNGEANFKDHALFEGSVGFDSNVSFDKGVEFHNTTSFMSDIRYKGVLLENMLAGGGANLDNYYTIPEVDNLLANVESVAKGRSTGYVFDTVDDMNIWLSNYDNTSKLILGDNLYIRATDVPDYWWDGSQPQELETQKVDLTEYANKATTLSGYGINDAYTKEEVESLIDSKINDAILSLIGGSY